MLAGLSAGFEDTITIVLVDLRLIHGLVGQGE